MIVDTHQAKGENPDAINTIFYWATITDSMNKTIYINLDRKFLFCLYEGKKYKFIAFDYNSNAIIVCPMPNRAVSTIVNTFQSICNML